MDINVIEEKENPFFERKEIKLELNHEGEATPPKNKLLEEISSKYKVEKDLIVIDYIFSKKGANKSIAKVKVYKKKPKIKKKGKKVEKPKEEKRGGKPKEEKPKGKEERKKIEKESKPEEKKKEGKSETQTS